MTTTGEAASSRTALRMVAIALLVAGGYYAGTLVGLALRLPDATPSVLWPPNAILTAALLLTPGRWWPVVLLSALPAHVVLQIGTGWPMSLVLALFATNCSEALIAAGGMRWLSDEPTRFDSLRRVVVFLLVAVIAAPVLSSFLDAGAVSWLQGEPYWLVWRSRLFSNMLTAATLVPALVTFATSARAWLRNAPLSAHLEAAVLAASMLLCATILLRQPAPGPMAIAITERMHVTWLLPFLLWAAIRFGPGGVSHALLASTFLLVGAAVYSQGPFAGLSAAETTLALQLLLLFIAIPLLVVAALIEERWLSQQDTFNRLAFEALLARLSTSFVQAPSEDMHKVFSDSLRQIGDLLSLDSLMLLSYSDTTRELTLVCAWTPPGSPSVRTDFGLDFPLAIERLLHSESGRAGDREHARGDRDDTAIWKDDGAIGEYGFTSGRAIPLLADDRLLGVLAFTSLRSNRVPEATLDAQVQLFARMLASALGRKRSDDSMRASEAMKSAILASLTSGVVVVDRRGRIIAVNSRWRAMAGTDAPATATDVGADYIEFYRARGRSGEAWAWEAAAGIEAVLRDTRRAVNLEHVSRQEDGDRWFVMRVAPLDRPDGGAVVTHTDISDQRRAERAAQRARAELTHVSRVSTMGALAASIAHQLYQPLTGILTNAQAARRFLSATPPDVDEARASLSDIIDDDRRAGEVIERMRELLRKDTAAMTAVDLNTVVADVARLLSSDAGIGDVDVSLQLEGGRALVRGDRVQLQQVVLNLLMNAFDAVRGRPADRRVVVRCARLDHEFVEVAVIDSGEGFTDNADNAFEAFYTTKQNGMGMGLSIARLIVEAHAGAIRAMNNTDGGATVCFKLPLLPHQAS